MRKKWKLTDFIFLCFKITADSDCSYEIRRCLLLGRKAMTSLYSVLKAWDMTLLTKVHIVKDMVLQVGMYGCESWTIKKAEHWRLMLLNCSVGVDSWEALRVQEIKPVNPKGNQPWIFIGSTILKLKFQYFGFLTHWKRPWCWERLKAGGEGDHRGWDGWMASLTQWTWVWASSGRWWWTGKPGMLQSMGSQRVGHYWVTEKQPQIGYISPWAGVISREGKKWQKCISKEKLF